MKKDDGKTLSQLTKQVNQTLSISDVLAGRTPLQGKLGKKLAKAQQDEVSLSKGKKIRSDKFKSFDKYLERMELIANRDASSSKKIKIERALIKDPKDSTKII